MGPAGPASGQRPRGLMPMSPSPATPLMDEQVHGDQNRRWTLDSKNHTIFDGCLFLDARRGSGLITLTFVILPGINY